jgi:hypothetical protein
MTFFLSYVALHKYGIRSALSSIMLRCTIILLSDKIYIKQRHEWIFRSTIEKMLQKGSKNCAPQLLAVGGGHRPLRLEQRSDHFGA